MEVDRIASVDVHEQIPFMESEKFLLREIKEEVLIGHDGTRYGSYLEKT